MSFTNRKNLSARRSPSVAIALSIAGLLAAGTSCSSGPQPPQPGTPAFYWAAANQTYRAGDFLKTVRTCSESLLPTTSSAPVPAPGTR